MADVCLIQFSWMSDEKACYNDANGDNDVEPQQELREEKQNGQQQLDDVSTQEDIVHHYNPQTEGDVMPQQDFTANGPVMVPMVQQYTHYYPYPQYGYAPVTSIPMIPYYPQPMQTMQMSMPHMYPEHLVNSHMSPVESHHHNQQQDHQQQVYHTDNNDNEVSSESTQRSVPRRNKKKRPPGYYEDLSAREQQQHTQYQDNSGEYGMQSVHPNMHTEQEYANTMYHHERIPSQDTHIVANDLANPHQQVSCVEYGSPNRADSEHPCIQDAVSFTGGGAIVAEQQSRHGTYRQQSHMSQCSTETDRTSSQYDRESNYDIPVADNGPSMPVLIDRSELNAGANYDASQLSFGFDCETSNDLATSPPVASHTVLPEAAPVQHLALEVEPVSSNEKQEMQEQVLVPDTTAIDGDQSALLSNDEAPPCDDGQDKPLPVEQAADPQPVAAAPAVQKPASWAGLFSGTKPAQNASVVYTGE